MSKANAHTSFSSVYWYGCIQLFTHKNLTEFHFLVEQCYFRLLLAPPCFGTDHIIRLVTADKGYISCSGKHNARVISRPVFSYAAEYLENYKTIRIAGFNRNLRSILFKATNQPGYRMMQLPSLHQTWSTWSIDKLSDWIVTVIGRRFHTNAAQDSYKSHPRSLGISYRRFQLSE